MLVQPANKFVVLEFKKSYTPHQALTWISHLVSTMQVGVGRVFATALSALTNRRCSAWNRGRWDLNFWYNPFLQSKWQVSRKKGAGLSLKWNLSFCGKSPCFEQESCLHWSSTMLQYTQQGTRKGNVFRFVLKTGWSCWVSYLDLFTRSTARVCCSAVPWPLHSVPWDRSIASPSGNAEILIFDSHSFINIFLILSYRKRSRDSVYHIPAVTWGKDATSSLSPVSLFPHLRTILTADPIRWAF